MTRQATHRERERKRENENEERERKRETEQRERKRELDCRMRADTHGDQKRGGKHIAAYHHSGITVVTQHATERATEREREREKRERTREREREREREKERKSSRERERRVLVCGSGVLISIRCAWAVVKTTGRRGCAGTDWGSERGRGLTSRFFQVFLKGRFLTHCVLAWYWTFAVERFPPGGPAGVQQTLPVTAYCVGATTGCSTGPPKGSRFSSFPSFWIRLGAALRACQARLFFAAARAFLARSAFCIAVRSQADWCCWFFQSSVSLVMVVHAYSRESLRLRNRAKE